MKYTQTRKLFLECITRPCSDVPAIQIVITAIYQGLNVPSFLKIFPILKEVANDR